MAPTLTSVDGQVSRSSLALLPCYCLYPLYLLYLFFFIFFATHHVAAPRVQGDCKTVPASSLPCLALDAAVRPKQCLICVDKSFLKWDGSDAHQVWIDNLYIKLKPRIVDSQVTLISFSPKGVQGKLWATGISMEGDGRVPVVTPGQESWCAGMDTNIGSSICSGVVLTSHP
jgi:hypothetical protein